MNPLAVQIDISSLPYGRGVSRYTANLVQALAERTDIDLSLFAVTRSGAKQVRQWQQEHVSLTPLKLWPVPVSTVAWSWDHFGLPKPWWGTRAQVFHAWDWQLPFGGKFPRVVTIHDLAYKLFPETAHPDVAHRYDLLLRQLEKHPEVQIIAVSDSTKNDIVRLTSITVDRIHVVPEALPSEAKFVPAEVEVTACLEKLKLYKPFLLAVGTTEPRKNLQRVVEAWRKQKQHFDLVLAGAPGWDDLPQEPGLHHLGYVSASDLACLYRRAHALVYVSLYEGFGLPILEAYFHGCPVITSRTSSLPAVAGKPALLVDPYNVDEIATAFGALEPAGSSARVRRQKDMLEQLNTFSWQTVAAQTLAVYKKAVS